ncbi:MAG: hypothetical protein K2X77_33460 [Candidatus Obscuribacterales bacterium]|nr:hypothetical protein [Candidatus Obscuribacterales bacterium]
MISAEIRNPSNKLPYMEFCHHNTTLVAVPHGEKSELWLQCDRPATLVIEAGGSEVSVVELQLGTTVVSLSDLYQPHVPGRSIGGIVPSFDFGIFKHVKQPKIQQRLFSFSATVKAGKPDGHERAQTLATFRFHLLCIVDFHWARAIKLGTGGDPASAEGTCPACKVVSDRLKSDWRFET